MEKQALDELKKKAALKATEFIKPGMIVGLGSGSTICFFIEALGLLCQRGMSIQAIAASSSSSALALKHQIPLLKAAKIDRIDITVDGTDEVDAEFRMIKGGGGALMREKILASSSEAVIIIIDETKLSLRFARHKLPIEISPFGCQLTMQKINRLGVQGMLRRSHSKELFLTDNGNYIYDIDLVNSTENIETLNYNLLQLPGVIETGFFYGYVTLLITSFQNGKVTLQQPIKKRM